ncbi:hypothetical protein LH452_12750 [Laribacter hongkongensis]|uniref:hypothetical protein n=1 Tax=Laribacter hongkongensis TaxID=168471 RepID=UPI001EFDE5E3|nr:hypothetical protein [Laribacter hongkongensis]MCG9059784.1 hypothetical protein [Laribacter hongkongensis]MCG9084051.1 hypothetical protein [Laribacter hongkongensis]MCG9086524.1 hypothetical protein [Laribacter hongkongensis]
MQTFREVNNQLLIDLIGAAKKRIVFIAPGVYLPVAEALAKRFHNVSDLNVTVVLDHDDEVCRLGYGTLEGLLHLQAQAKQKGFWLRTEPGLRVGVLLTDDNTLLWSPTPQSIEAPPGEPKGEPADLLTPPTRTNNGLMLGDKPLEQISRSIVAEGEDLDPKSAEIGHAAVTPDDIERTQAALQRNPAVPVDLQRITRVYSTKLQFVEFKVRNARLSRTQFTLSNDLLNVDAKDELKGLLDSRLRAYADLRDQPVEVPAFTDGKPTFNQSNTRLMTPLTEADLDAQRREIERKFTYDIPGFGRLIAKEDLQLFEQRIRALETQIKAHAQGLKTLLETQTNTIRDEAVELIEHRLRARPQRAGQGTTAKADRKRHATRTAGRTGSHPDLQGHHLQPDQGPGLHR